MSTPKITEKELAKALDDGMDNMLDNTGDLDTLALARRAAELLGVTLAPEKPEPGTCRGLFGAVLDRPVLVDRDANIYYLNDEGELIEGAIHTKGEFDGLVPARVIPAEPMEDARSRAVDIIEEVVKNHIRVRLNIADTGGENAHSGTINQIRHLHLAEPHLPAVEAANRLRDAGVLSALAKHGEARELPGRDEVRAIISNLGSHRATTDSITDALMDLLRDGDRG